MHPSSLFNDEKMSFDLDSNNYFNGYNLYGDSINGNDNMNDLDFNKMDNRKPGLNNEVDSKTFETTFNKVFNPKEEEESFKTEPDNFNIINNENINNNEIVKEKEKIFKISKVKKKGRQRKNCTKEAKHNKKSMDNGTRAIINQSPRASICPFLEESAKEFSKIYNKRGYKLGPYKSNGFLVKNYKKQAEFFDTSVKKLLCNVNTKVGLHNKRKINNLLEYEMNNDNIKIKKLNLLFNAPNKIYMNAILDDDKYITINGHEFYLGDNFKTLKDYFNTGDKIFTNEEKQVYKKNILEIMNRKKHTRKPKNKKV